MGKGHVFSSMFLFNKFGPSREAPKKGASKRVALRPNKKAPAGDVQSARSRRSRVRSQTQLSPAPGGRAGLRTSVSITPGRSAIGIN